MAVIARLPATYVTPAIVTPRLVMVSLLKYYYYIFIADIRLLSLYVIYANIFTIMNMPLIGYAHKALRHIIADCRDRATPAAMPSLGCHITRRWPPQHTQILPRLFS